MGAIVPETNGVGEHQHRGHGEVPRWVRKSILPARSNGRRAPNRVNRASIRRRRHGSRVSTIPRNARAERPRLRASRMPPASTGARRRRGGGGAPRSRAFGGARHGIATGVALSENRRNQNEQIAGLLGSGFEGAMGRAGQLAGMGFDAAGAGANLGMTAGNPDLWRMEMLRRALQGLPYGTTSRGTSGQTGTRLGHSSEVSIPFFG